jgi:SET domain-containing protein
MHKYTVRVQARLNINHNQANENNDIRSLINLNRKKKKHRVVRLSLFKDEEVEGLGVVSLDDVPAGIFITSYKGHLKTIKEYCSNNNDIYKFFFNVKSRQYYIDASDSSHISRYINHSVLRDNIIPIREGLSINFYSKRFISAGEPLYFDYGDRNSDLPWLKCS